MCTDKWKTLIRLFFNTFYISSCTFGGGFVIITFMKRVFVDKYHWIDEEEMLDLSAIAQSSPGAIAVNAAILIGWRMAGFWGVLVSVLGTILPPMVILSILAVFYNAFSANEYIRMFLKGLQAGVAAVILNVAWDLGEKVIKEKSVFSTCTMIVSFGVVFFLKINVVIVIAIAVVVGIIRSIIYCKGEARA